MPTAVSRAQRPHAASPRSDPGGPAAPQLRVIASGSCPFVQDSCLPGTLKSGNVDEFASQPSEQVPKVEHRRGRPEGRANEARIRQALDTTDLQVDISSAITEHTFPAVAVERSSVQRTPSSFASVIGHTPSALDRTPLATDSSVIHRTKSTMSPIARSPSTAPDALFHKFTEAQLQSYKVISTRIRDANAQLRV